MEAITNLLPKKVSDLVRATKENPRNTRVWAKFAAFQTLNDPQLERMKDETVSFMDDLFNNREPRWLSLLGTSGAGKTMLAKGVWRLFQEHRHMEINWPRSKATEHTPEPRIFRWRGGFINWGKAVNDRMLQGDYDFLQDLSDYDFFAIDDIVSEYEKHRSLSASKLYNVMESRLNKWTIWTANLSLQQLGEQLDPRISSRMLRNNSVVMDVDVPDFNLRKP